MVKQGRRIGLVLFVLAMAFWLAWTLSAPAKTPIKLGVLHALSGTMATSEAPLVEALAFAVAEVNQQGGVLGRPLELVVADTQSDAEVARQQAEWLIAEQGVQALFGCWTSACRQAVKPVVEAYNHVLFYPVQYEGMEASPNIIYTGAAPNQQIVPGARWGMQRFGPRVFLLGSDYVFPRVANLIISDLVKVNGGTIVGEAYLPLGEQDVSEFIAQIKTQQPSLILNTLNGDSNRAFFDALVAADLGDTPIISFSVAEPELVAWGGGRLTQHFGVWSFFQSMDDARSLTFMREFQAFMGAPKPISDPMVASYLGLKLWARSANYEGALSPHLVNSTFLSQLSLPAHGYIEVVDNKNLHLSRQVRIGQVQPDGQYQTLFKSHHLIRPTPWPDYRSRVAWQALLTEVLP